MSGKGTSLWRVAGMSYLQYVNKSAAVVREALKEPVKSKLVPRSDVNFAGFKWADGERGKRGTSPLRVHVPFVYVFAYAYAHVRDRTLYLSVARVFTPRLSRMRSVICHTTNSHD